MIFASISAATGQLFWKLGLSNYFILILGFLFYAVGALLMIKSFQIEKLSIAYPIMCTSYIIAMFYGYFFLDEQITIKSITAVILLIIGVTLTSYED